MLPRASRLTRAADFRRVVRTGRRAGSATLVVHRADSPLRPRAGFVVSRAVGNSVVRNRVQRRLRSLVAGLDPEWMAGSDLVVRALPPAAEASYAQLHDDLVRCLQRASS